MNGLSAQRAHRLRALKSHMRGVRFGSLADIKQVRWTGALDMSAWGQSVDV